MPARPILVWPDRRLRTPADAVPLVDDRVRAIWNDMVDTMDAMPGVGLAAPQIGVMLRLAVVDASDERGQSVRLANPEIIGSSATSHGHEEASPCLPGASARVDRPSSVTVRFVDETGEMVTRDFMGLWATSVQHQIDHLAGRMYYDRLSRTKRQMLLKRARKQG